MTTPNLTQLRRAVDVAQQIETLQAELGRILGVNAPVSAAKPDDVIPLPKQKGKRTMSRAARAKISKAAKARWADRKKTSGGPGGPDVVTAKKKRKLSPEGRANIAAAQRARWAEKKKAAE